MRIKSIIRRKAGSSQTIDGVTYRWNDANGHVCDVENEAHAALLLAIPSGWVAAEDVQDDADQAVEDAPQEAPKRGRPRKVKQDDAQQ